MQDSPETIAILRRMVEVRRDLDEGAQEIAESARDLGEWQHYVKSYPWISMGLACAIGYIIVPRRRSGSRSVNQTTVEFTDHNQLPNSQSTWTSGIRTGVKMFAANMLWRGVMSFAARQANQYFAGQFNSSLQEDET